MRPDELARLVGAMRIFDLEHPRRLGDPVFPPHQPGTMFLLHRRHEPGGGERRSSASGFIFTAEHAGTHIDAFVHQAVDMTLYGGVAVSPAVQTPAGFTQMGIDTVPPLIGRGVLLDVAALRGGRLAEGAMVTAVDLAETEKAQGLEVAAGDVALVRTGNDEAWGDPERYLRGPGISREASEWLAARKVRAVGADNVAWDLPGYVDEGLGMALPGHVVLLVQAGIYIIENLNLAELASERCHDFLFLCLPLKIRGGTASPVRPLGLAPLPGRTIS